MNMTTETGEQATVLAEFDQARDAFLAAFAEAPDAALAYLPEGEEYALGALLLHLAGTLQTYTLVLNRLLLVPAGDAVIDYSDSEDLSLQAREAVIAARPTPTERAGLLAGLATAHTQFRDRLATFPAARFDQEVPVLYPGGGEPYPTSPRAVAGWVTDHYREHTAQVTTMLRDWPGAE
jgi:hypothetical protein